MCVAHPVLAVAETAASGRGTGAYEAARSTVGAEYAFDRVDAEAGVSVSLAEDVHAWVAAHYLTGSANVSAATGGGEIKVTGLGPALGVAWGGASPYYAGAGYALTVYDIDLSSSTRGRLHAGGTGYGHSVDLEMGRHIALGERMTLTPRARAVGSGCPWTRSRMRSTRACRFPRRIA